MRNQKTPCIVCGLFVVTNKLAYVMVAIKTLARGRYRSILISDVFHNRISKKNYFLHYQLGICGQPFFSFSVLISAYFDSSKITGPITYPPSD